MNTAAAIETLRAFRHGLDRTSVRRSPPAELGIARAKFEGADTAAVSGYASVFGVVDQQNEIVEPGAFADSLARHRANGTRPLLLWQHDPRQPIGVWDDLTEDSVGLRVGRILPEVRQGAEALALIRAGGIFGLSIGYREILAVEPQRAGAPRRLLKVDLLEVSVVSFPSNGEARVSAGKSKAGKSEFDVAFARFAAAAVKASAARRRDAEVKDAIGSFVRYARRAGLVE